MVWVHNFEKEYARRKEIKAAQRAIYLKCESTEDVISQMAIGSISMCHLPEYDIYRTMINRCHNPNSASYVDYGKRGIHVSEKWRTGFMEFFLDMGKRHGDIDRIDNEKGYSKENCRWTTKNVNSHNRRAFGSFAKGVHYNKKNKKFSSSITVNKQNYFLGYYETEELAKTQYDKMAIEWYGAI